MKNISFLGSFIFLLGVAGLYFGPSLLAPEEPEVPVHYESVLPTGNTTPYPTTTPMGFSLRCAREPYEPVCGKKEVQCIQAPCDPVEETYPNECAAIERGAEIAYLGLCEADKPKTIETTPQPPEKHYKSREIDVCSRIRFLCEAGMVPFSDPTGCGCETESALTENIVKPNTEKPVEDDGRIYYNGCPHVLFQLQCPDGFDIFSNDLGCGCEPIEEITEEPPLPDEEAQTE